MSGFITPFEFSGTEMLSRRLYRKKVLPVGSISYNGKKIDFTQDYLRTMASAFDDGAFDNVPLQFADAANAHTNDPERYRGDVVAMSVEPDGLYVTVSATPEGAKILQENPKLGISARIINEYDRADGKHYDAAVQHVLATHDPRIPGLGPWSSVENYSNDDDSGIIDLTAEEFAGPKTTKEKPVADKTPDALTEDELAQLRAFLAELDTEDAASDEVDPTQLSDDELNALVESLADEVEAETEAVDPEPELADASLSNDNADKALELANSQATELSRIRGELDEQRWSNERVSFAKDHGIPPAILDLAAPLLKGEGHTFELSNGDKTDAGKVMRDVLTEVGKLVKLLDLSNELGSSVEETPDHSADAEARREETTKAVRAMMGN